MMVGFTQTMMVVVASVLPIPIHDVLEEVKQPLYVGHFWVLHSPKQKPAKSDGRNEGPLTMFVVFEVEEAVG